MSYVIAIVAPVFGIILLGLVAGRTGYLADHAEKAIVGFVFRVAVPALMFRMLLTAPPVDGDPLALYAAFFGPIAVVWLLASLISRLVLGEPAPDGAVHAFASIFGNLVLLGLPITLSALGPEAATPIAILFLLEFPLLWLAATLHLTLASRRGAGGLAASAGTLALDLIKNPIIVAVVAGALWRMTGLGLHAIPDRVLELLGRAATPGALFALGMTLARFEISGQSGVVAMILALKMLVQPALAWILAFKVLSLPPVWAGVIVLFAAMPPGAVPYLFATQHDRAVSAVAASIAIGMALAVVSVSVALYMLGTEAGLALRSGP